MGFFASKVSVWRLAGNKSACGMFSFASLVSTFPLPLAPFPSHIKLYLDPQVFLLLLFLFSLIPPEAGQSELVNNCVGAGYGHLTTLDKYTPCKKGFCGIALISFIFFFPNFSGYANFSISHYTVNTSSHQFMTAEKETAVQLILL